MRHFRVFPYAEEAALAPPWVAGVARDGKDERNGFDGSDWMYNRRGARMRKRKSSVRQNPAEKWELALPNPPEAKNHCKNDEIEDILPVSTYSGVTPAWPF